MGKLNSREDNFSEVGMPAGLEYRLDHLCYQKSGRAYEKIVGGIILAGGMDERPSIKLLFPLKVWREFGMYHAGLAKRRRIL